ncbi:hypothetical protein CbC4_5038 (plasmid) [Clostridium botulinum BKT015925]|nr:hypothetical protein CbC4_5038 [Clostridium botulinum BKT015925]
MNIIIKYIRLKGLLSHKSSDVSAIQIIDNDKDINILANVKYQYSFLVALPQNVIYLDIHFL